MTSQETRQVCHKKYRSGEWYPVQYEITITMAYREHIEMHPNDYWGKCKEEIVPIPDIANTKDWGEEGFFGERIRPRRRN